MAAPQEKAQTASWFIEKKSDVQTQRKYRSKYGKDPPSRSSFRRWHKNFQGARVSSSMKHFQTDGLEKMDQFQGYHVHQTLLPWTSFCGDT